MESSDTPLHKAARQGDTEAIVVLIDAGANPNAKDDSGTTPLHMAAEKGHAKAIATPLAADADPIAQDGSGTTPIRCSPGTSRTRSRETSIAIGFRPAGWRTAVWPFDPNGSRWTYEVPTARRCPRCRRR